LAGEAAGAVLAWADLKWPGGETVCMIAPENVASLRLAGRLGYVEFAWTAYKGEPVILHSRRSG